MEIEVTHKGGAVVELTEEKFQRLVRGIVSRFEKSGDTFTDEVNGKELHFPNVLADVAIREMEALGYSEDLMKDLMYERRLLDAVAPHIEGLAEIEKARKDKAKRLNSGRR